jgi:hypothetical protein
LNSQLFKEAPLQAVQPEPSRPSDIIKNVVIERAPYGTNANWKNPITNSRVDNKVKIDAFKEKQKQMTSNALPISRDYSPYQAMTRKFVDQDNLYDEKRMKDPFYSDLFDQCINTGGKRPSPIRKKFDELDPVQKDWTHQDN